MIDGARKQLEIKYKAALSIAMACSAWSASSTFMFVNGDLDFTNWRWAISDALSIFLVMKIYPLLKRWRPELMSIQTVEEQNVFGPTTRLDFGKTRVEHATDINFWAGKKSDGTVH